LGVKASNLAAAISDVSVYTSMTDCSSVTAFLPSFFAAFANAAGSRSQMPRRCSIPPNTRSRTSHSRDVMPL
jgi:hypothetical protein